MKIQTVSSVLGALLLLQLAFAGTVRAAAPDPGKNSLGCFALAPGDGPTKVSKPWTSSADLNAATHETCAAACKKQKTLFAGLHGSHGCLCGNWIGAYGTSEKCTETCTQNDKQLCGGPAEVRVFPTGLFFAQPIGCFKDTKEKRDLDGFLGKSAKAVPASCMSYCRGKHFTFAGLQAGSWCACGNKHGTHGKATNCDQKCSGDAKRICGGAYANSVYLTGYRPPKAVPTETEEKAAANVEHVDPATIHHDVQESK